MQWLIHHMADGDAFVVAGVVALILLPALAWGRRRMSAAALLGVLVCAIIMGLSSMPVPLVLFAGWVGLLVLVMGLRIGRSAKIGVVAAIVLAEVLGLLMLVSELSWRQWRGIPPVRSARVYVIGDSLSAGTGREFGQTWPRILAATHQIEVIDFSVAAATTASIMHRFAGVTFEDGLVIIEIGGNDVFRRHDPRTFERDLEALILRLLGPGRVLAMFELPLYPLNGEYGRIQRRIAQSHNIVLIPRHVLTQIIITPGNTIEDGLHLSVAGQRFMATRIWELIGPALPQ